MRKTGNRRERGAKPPSSGGRSKIVNSVSKSERESIIAALHGQSIFNGGGLSPLNKISPSHPPKPATVAVPEETEKKSA